MAHSQNSSKDGDLYFEKPLSHWERLGAHHTVAEILQQPGLWKTTLQLVIQQQNQLAAFLQQAFSHDDIEIILTGAGTSAFIGDILKGPFQKNTGKSTYAIATTNLITHPQHHFHCDRPTLLVSFARSGNSPESLAAVQLANMFCNTVYHLIITCSASGKLVLANNDRPAFVFLLPTEANDQGLAMTGSFSSMLLAGLLISRIHHLNKLAPQVEQLSHYGNHILETYGNKLREVATLPFDRAVFLGAGPLYGTARESHLKMQELTDGKIICKYDSFLGFRHGPKVVISPSTLLVYLFSNNSYAHRYEVDLVKAINDGEKGLYRIGISESPVPTLGLDLELILNTNNASPIDEEFLAVCSIVPTQILSFFKSLECGLEPDSPSQNGSITRVVEGVTIYPLPQVENGLENHATSPVTNKK